MERHLAAILVADVAGYSRLMGADETATLNDLERHRAELIEPKAEQHHGRIVKLMGDGVLMEFASVIDAVIFAVDVQAAMRARNAEVSVERRIEFRIGINIGDVIAKNGDVHGDGVNVASRLEASAKPGGINLSLSARDQVRDKLDIILVDLGEHQFKNIARPIRVFQIAQDAKSEALATPIVPVPAKTEPLPINRMWRIASAAALILSAIVMIAWWRPWQPEFEPATVAQMALPLPDKPSIVILPFDNLSDDPAQEYFADGITEDLITDLSKISGLFVIGRNSSFAYKGKNAPVRQVAEELGVRFVLAGSVRRAGERLRINAQLIDAVTGGPLWADRYDGERADVFEFQDSVTSNIVPALAISLTGTEANTQVDPGTSDPDAYDAFLRGWSHYRRGTLDDLAVSISAFEHALELDPGFDRAQMAQAAVYALAVERNRLGATTLWTQRLGLNTDAAIVEVGKRLESAGNTQRPLAHQVASGRLIFLSKYDASIAEAEKAIKLDPNDPASYNALARALTFAGTTSEAIGQARLAMRLDPHHPGEYLFWQGLAQFGEQQFDQAAATLQKAVQTNSDDERSLIVLAAARGHLGQFADANVAITSADGLRLTRVKRLEKSDWRAGVDTLLVGKYSLADVDWWPFKSRADRERLRDGLRLAGVPAAGGEENVSPTTILGAQTVDAARAFELHSRGVTFIDVRGVASWDSGHIPGAINLDLNSDFTEAAVSSAVQKNEPVVIYCAGPRCLLSSKACLQAIGWGFEKVHYFREGFPSWKAAGYPIAASNK